MVTWQEIIQRYHIKHHNQIAKTASPLRTLFQVTCIDYIKIHTSGKFCYLTNRPDCAEYYASEQLFLSDPYFKHPATHRAGFFPLESLGSNEFKENNKKVSSQFNLHLPLILSKKIGDSVEFFGFAGENLETLQSLFLYHSSLFKLFATHFKKELSSVIKRMDEEDYSLVDLQGDYFYEGVDPPHALDQSSLHTYLIALGKKKEVEQASSLTPRERECLKLLINGNSAKDTAMQLRLSPRTVESYLENIKNKFLCLNKRELFSIAAHFADLGLL